MRALSSQLQALLLQGALRLNVFARCYLTTGVYGASDSAWTFTWDNGLGDGPVTFGGFGKAFKASVPPSTSVMDASSTTGQLQLSATDPQILATFLGSGYRAQRVDVGILFFDTTTNQPVGEMVAFRGLMDTAGVADSPADPQDPSKPVTSTLTLLIQPRTVDMKRAGFRTRSDVDQRLYRDPNDPFFQDVGLVAQTQINWDRAGPTTAASIAGLPQPNSGVTAAANLSASQP